MAYLNERPAGSKASSFSLMVPPPFSVSRRTAPTVLFLPSTISSVATAGCQAAKPSKSFTVFQTLDAEASMVTCLLVVSRGAAAKTYPHASMDTPNAIADLIFIVLIPREENYLDHYSQNWTAAAS